MFSTTTQNSTFKTNFQTKMSYQTAPISPNPYIIQKLNNIDEAKALKEERRDWTRTYYKTLKEIEVMIDVQRWIKDIIKMAEETNTMIVEMKGSILEASINNRLINATNIAEISEDLRYLVQSDMENWTFQIQRILADELNAYRGKENSYVDDNIQEIQDLYKEEGRIKEKEVILIKPYKVSESTMMLLA